MEELFKRLAVAVASNFVSAQISRHGLLCGCERCSAASVFGFVGGPEVTTAFFSSSDA